MLCGWLITAALLINAAVAEVVVRYRNRSKIVSLELTMGNGCSPISGYFKLLHSEDLPSGEIVMHSIQA